MPYLATNLVQNILSELGQVESNFVFDAIGGTATTIVAGTSSSGFGLLTDPPEDSALVGQFAIVVRDAAGAGASPEGKWGIISNYVDSTWTMTIPTVTDAVAAGDTIMLAKQDKFPISRILTSINQGLQSLGDLPNNADTTSIVPAVNQTEYDIPVAAKRGLKQVWIQGNVDTNDNRWMQVFDGRNDLTSAGAASVIYLPNYIVGRTVKLVYDGAHAVVSSYSSPINEYVHPTVAICASILKLLEWYNRQDANQDAQSYFLFLEKEYRERYLPKALMDFPIRKSRRTPKYSTFGQPHRDSPPQPFI